MDTPRLNSATNHSTDPYDQMGSLYDAWCRSVIEDIPWYRALATVIAEEEGSAGLQVVELGAGSGRITIPLLKDGHAVRAIDRSQQLLAILSATAAEYPRLTMVACDFAADGSWVQEEGCDLVIAPFRTLMHVDREIGDVLARVYSSLRPGGWFAFDVAHVDDENVLAEDWTVRDMEKLPSGERVVFSERTRAVQLPNESRAVDDHNNAPEGDATRFDLDVQFATVTTTDQITMHLVARSARVWQELLAHAGFTIDSVFSDFDESPFVGASTNSIWVARRP